MKRALSTLALCVIALLAAAALWQAIAGAIERRRYPPRGTMIDAGGHRLLFDIRGGGLPGPTVLLETGIGGATSRSWAWVERAIANDAPVVAYDRAGLGASEPGPMPRDGLRLVAELHTALGNAGLPPPYIYVGHSYGGLLARLFTERYPSEVLGAVLVESSHPGQFPRMTRAYGWIGPLLPLAPWAARFGVMRAFVQVVHTDADQLPSPEREEQRAWIAAPRHWVGVVRELAAWFPLTAPEAARTHGFGSRPLVVLTAGSSARHWGRWGELQRELARLSSDGIHQVVAGATHGSIVSDSTHAAVIVAAIRDVLEATRTHRTLRAVVAGRGPL